jgi:hypothetical protein
MERSFRRSWAKPSSKKFQQNEDLDKNKVLHVAEVDD